MDLSAQEHHVPQKIRVLVCDDHDLVRGALRTIIDGESDMEVVGEACDGEQALALAIELHPDAVVMDIEMPKASGIQATRGIKRVLPDATILVLTVHDSSEYILGILEAGATGYLTKSIISREIPNAIRAARSGESTLSEEILRKLLEYALQFPCDSRKAPLRQSLTGRELAVLGSAAEGLSNKAIAGRLEITENTVKKYMMSVFDKLGVQSRTAAVVVAQQRGLL